MDEKGDLAAAQKGDMPPGDEILYEVRRNRETGAITRTPYLLKKQILLTGDVITDAKVNPDNMGRMIVHMDFNRQGATAFERITGEHVREKLAIILDNRVYSPP